MPGGVARGARGGSSRARSASMRAASREPPAVSVAAPSVRPDAPRIASATRATVAWLPPVRCRLRRTPYRSCTSRVIRRPSRDVPPRAPKVSCGPMPPVPNSSSQRATSSPSRPAGRPAGALGRPGSWRAAPGTSNTESSSAEQRRRVYGYVGSVTRRPVPSSSARASTGTPCSQASASAAAMWSPGSASSAAGITYRPGPLSPSPTTIR